MSASINEVRTNLATALGTIGATVYGWVPEAILPPACVIIPDSPYLESTLISNSSVSVKINFTISAAVGAMPDGYVVGDVQRPTITNVNTSSLLIADISVSTYYNQDQP